MTSLLDRIYSGEYSVNQQPVSPDSERLSQTFFHLLEQLGSEQDQGLVSQLWEVALDWSEQEQKDAFRAGARFGSRLMLELMDCPPGEE